MFDPFLLQETDPSPEGPPLVLEENISDTNWNKCSLMAPARLTSRYFYFRSTIHHMARSLYLDNIRSNRGQDIPMLFRSCQTVVRLWSHCAWYHIKVSSVLAWCWDWLRFTWAWHYIPPSLPPTLSTTYLDTLRHSSHALPSSLPPSLGLRQANYDVSWTRSFTQIFLTRLILTGRVWDGADPSEKLWTDGK